MRKFNIFLALAFLFTSCVVDDLQYIENGPRDIESGIKIFGTAQDFDIKKVTTRADESLSELPSDSFISEMTMFVFDKNDKIIQGYSNRTVNNVDSNGLPTSVTFNDADKCSSAVNIQKANPTFLIDTKDGLIASLDDAAPRIIYYDNLTSNDNDISACKIYIVANAWHVLEEKLDSIKTLSDLEAITLDIDESLSMPKKDDTHYRGFPMIGTHSGQTFDLSKDGTNAGAVAKIPLKKLYSKVSFTIQVNANEVVSTPRFKIEKAEVFNVPKKARLGRELDSNGKPTYENSDDYIVEMVGNDSYKLTDYYHFTETPAILSTESFSRTEIQHTTSKKLTEGSEYLIEFSFYMPEHKVTPNANRSTFTGYPTNIDEDLKQYYKPELVGAVRNDDGTATNSKNATYVRIHGKYYDHNGQIKNVRYDIYLGQDNTDDFTVKRNQLLTNKLVITGLTNYHDAYTDVQGNISIDHRVDVDYAGFNLSMERTAILDSHFEVRPLDIELSPGSTMTITIPEGYRDWVGMESDVARYTENGKYVNTGNRKAVRKYFTTNLVSELNGGSKDYAGDNTTITARGSSIKIEYSAEAKESKIFRIWFYVDENRNVYDKTGATAPNSDSDGEYKVSKELYRNCPVQFKYFGTDYDAPEGGQATINKTVTINFQQWNLWRVWAKDDNKNPVRYYDIEHEEEYLNNYASDVQYGGTQNGMPYGLEGITLSKSVKAVYINTSGSTLGAIINFFGGNYDSWINSMIESSGLYPFYDFYLARDTRPTGIASRDHNGLTFNKEIAATLKASTGPKAKIDGIILTEDPKSALAYCYHKNKRNDDGTIDIDNIKWFLPAIDEIEEISMGAYDEFDKVFQKNIYWSCQPSAFNKTLKVEREKLGGWLGTETQTGDYMDDNPNRARATSVFYDPTNPNANDEGYVNISSGVNGNEGTYTLHFEWLGEFVKDKSGYNENTGSNLTNYDNHPGNLPRTQSCRIRAVYRSGTK